MLSPLPVAIEADWSRYVDTPLTGREVAKVRKKIERQTRGRGLAPQVPVPVGGEEV